MDFGEKIRALLEDKGLNQTNLADILFVSRATISSWMVGRYKPSSRHIKSLSLFFHIKVNWFYDDNFGFPPAPRFLLKSGEVLLNPNRPERLLPQNEECTNSEEESKDGENGPIEQLRDNLFLVHHPEIQKVFTELEETLRSRDTKRITRLCDRLKALLKMAAGKKAVLIRPLKEMDSELGEGEDQCNQCI